MNFFKAAVLIAFFAFGTDANSQRKIKKIEIQESGYNVQLKLIPQSSHTSYDGLSIKINPISASDLNREFMNQCHLNGDFNYSYYEKSRSTYFLKKRKIKREKSNSEFILEGAEWLFENEKITFREYGSLLDEINLFFQPDLEKEVYAPDNVSCNPYFLNNKYLTTFKIEISNQTDSFKIFNKNLLIESGNSLLQPLTTHEIVEQLILTKEMNSSKLEILERNHLKTITQIPPHSTFVKYFAILPLNFNNDDLLISFEGMDSKFKWLIEKKHESIDEKYTFYELTIDWLYDESRMDNALNFSIVSGSEGDIHVSNDALFIDEKSIGKEFKISTLALLNDDLYFGQTTLLGSDFIDRDKNKRKFIPIRLWKIKELNKNTKF